MCIYIKPNIAHPLLTAWKHPNRYNFMAIYTLSYLQSVVVHYKKWVCEDCFTYNTCVANMQVANLILFAMDFYDACCSLWRIVTFVMGNMFDWLLHFHAHTLYRDGLCKKDKKKKKVFSSLLLKCGKRCVCALILLFLATSFLFHFSAVLLVGGVMTHVWRKEEGRPSSGGGNRRPQLAGLCFLLHLFSSSFALETASPTAHTSKDTIDLGKTVWGKKLSMWTSLSL